MVVVNKLPNGIGQMRFPKMFHFPSLIKDQLKTSTSIDLHSCPKAGSDLASKGRGRVNAVRSQWTATRLANEKIHSIYNSKPCFH